MAPTYRDTATSTRRGPADRNPARRAAQQAELVALGVGAYAPALIAGLAEAGGRGPQRAPSALAWSP